MHQAKRGRTMAGKVFDAATGGAIRSEEHTSELQSQSNLVCRLLLEKKKQTSTDLTLLMLQRKPPLPALSVTRSTSYASAASLDVYIPGTGEAMLNTVRTLFCEKQSY